MGTLKRRSRVEITTSATPEAVWNVVSDVTRVGEWSHECQGGVWEDGATAARPGARFRGRNRLGLRAWTRVNEVVAAAEPNTFAWKTLPSMLYPDSTIWTITMEPVEGGTRVVQQYEVVKLGPLMDRIIYLTTPKHRDRTDALTGDLRRLGEVRARRHFVKMTRATLVVFGASAAVLVLEIIAGRLMAPYVGISLETFTGIIGTVLAGIAVGAAIGGVLADRYDPRALIGPALIIGGALAWLSMPVVGWLGPHVDNGPIAIVILTGAAFFLPVAVLSAVSPMVAKLRLASLTETGTVVGGLSAAGTVGALVGTFITGFVLVAAIPSKTIVAIVGALLIAAGILATWLLRQRPPVLGAVGLAFLVLWTGTNVANTRAPCEHETAYYCVRVEVAPNNPHARDLYLDRLRHAYVNLDDPKDLDIRYVKLFADIARAMPPGPLDALHIGGGGFSFPRYLDAERPGTRNRVLEIDGELVDIAKRELGLRESKDLQVDVGDARLALGRLRADSYDLVVGDAFAGESVPWHLTTAEVMSEVDRALRPNGIVMLNVIDGDHSRFARAELATLAAQFDHVAVILPEGGVPHDYPVNQVLVASDAPLPKLAIAPADGVLVDGAAVKAYIGGARRLTDDFAPVDQLVLGV